MVQSGCSRLQELCGMVCVVKQEACELCDHVGAGAAYRCRCRCKVCGKSGHCRVDKRKPTFSNISILHSCVVCCSFLENFLVTDHTRRLASSHRGCHRAIEASRAIEPSRLDADGACSHRCWASSHRGAIEAPSSFAIEPASSFAIEPSRPGLSG